MSADIAHHDRMDDKAGAPGSVGPKLDGDTLQLLSFVASGSYGQTKKAKELFLVCLMTKHLSSEIFDVPNPWW